MNGIRKAGERGCRPARSDDARPVVAKRERTGGATSVGWEPPPAPSTRPLPVRPPNESGVISDAGGAGYRRELDDDEPPELEPDDDPEDDADDEPVEEALDDDDDELGVVELDDVLLVLDPPGELELDAPPPAWELELDPVGCVNPSAQPAISPPPTSNVAPVSARRKLRRSCRASAVPCAVDSFDAVVG